MLSYHVHTGSGPYLLLAHGALSNSAQWTLNLPALQRFCTPVTVELLGHGDSPSPDDPQSYEADAYVEYFETIRKQLGASRWFLCGYSLSAGLTIRYALACPERVCGHLLTNSNSAFAEAAQIALWAAAGESTLAQAAKEGLSFLARMPIHPRFATALPKAVYNPLVERSKLLNPAGASRTLAITAPTASIRHRVADNTRPALLLQGIREKGFQSHATFARKAMPHLDVCELNAGHGVNMQAVDAFNTRVEEFVAAWDT